MRFYYVNQPKSEKIELRNYGKLKIPASLMVGEDCKPSGKQTQLANFTTLNLT